jgi:hypothetical protein
MKLETKFDVGDEVWYMSDNRCAKGSVVRVQAEFDTHPRPQFAAHCTIRISDRDIAEISEDYLFATKAELLASL